jgi:hypothetical protein
VVWHTFVFGNFSVSVLSICNVYAHYVSNEPLSVGYFGLYVMHEDEYLFIYCVSMCMITRKKW